jgi:hypothetical protein
MRSQAAVAAAALTLALMLPSAGTAQVMPKLPEEKPIGVINDTQGGLPKVQEQNGVTFISGGAGSEEADAFNRMSENFNLKLTMTVPSGQFTSPTMIRIEDKSGTPLVETKPNGPIFLAKMPAGDYVIQVNAEGQTLTRKATVPASGLEAIAMTWPAADEQPIRAGDAPQ